MQVNLAQMKEARGYIISIFLSMAKMISDVDNVVVFVASSCCMLLLWQLPYVAVTADVDDEFCHFR